MKQMLFKSMVWVSLITKVIHLQAFDHTESKDFQVQGRATSVEHNESHTLLSPLLHKHVTWPLAGIGIVSGALLLYLVDKKYATLEEAEKDRLTAQSLPSRVWAFLKSLKDSAHMHTSRVPALVYTHEVYTAGGLPCDDPEHHAVVAMYVAKDPTTSY